jgi:hypothetical protein
MLEAHRGREIHSSFHLSIVTLGTVKSNWIDRFDIFGRRFPRAQALLLQAFPRSDASRRSMFASA